MIKVRQENEATEAGRDEKANPVIKAGQDEKANPVRLVKPVSRARPRHVPQDSIATPTAMVQCGASGTNSTYLTARAPPPCVELLQGGGSAAPASRPACRTGALMPGNFPTAPLAPASGGAPWFFHRFPVVH